MKRHAFTLIELLIVVAVVAIFAGASLAVITAPAEDQHCASLDMQSEAGMGLFFSAIVADMHDATTVTLSGGSPGLLLSGLGGQERATRYWIDSRKQLRRASYATTAALAAEFASSQLQGSALLEGVELLEAGPLSSTGLWRVRVKARQSRFGRDFVLDRHMDVMAGDAWAGGPQ